MQMKHTALRANHVRVLKERRIGSPSPTARVEFVSRLMTTGYRLQSVPRTRTAEARSL